MAFFIQRIAIMLVLVESQMNCASNLFFYFMREHVTFLAACL